MVFCMVLALLWQTTCRSCTADQQQTQAERQNATPYLGQAGELLKQGCSDEGVCVGSLSNVVAHGQPLRCQLIAELGGDDACRAAAAVQLQSANSATQNVQLLPLQYLAQAGQARTMIFLLVEYVQRPQTPENPARQEHGLLPGASSMSRVPPTRTQRSWRVTPGLGAESAIRLPSSLQAQDLLVAMLDPMSRRRPSETACCWCGGSACSW